MTTTRRALLSMAVCELDTYLLLLWTPAYLPPPPVQTGLRPIFRFNHARIRRGRGDRAR
jgi:hypothetical protein